MKLSFAVNTDNEKFLQFDDEGELFFMVWLIRAGMYFLSGFTIWQFVHNPSLTNSAAHLSLDQVNGMVFGVCAGFSNYTGVDVSLIRLVFALAVFYRGIGVALYVLAFLILPVS